MLSRCGTGRRLNSPIRRHGAFNIRSRHSEEDQGYSAEDPGYKEEDPNHAIGDLECSVEVGQVEEDPMHVSEDLGLATEDRGT